MEQRYYKAVTRKASLSEIIRFVGRRRGIPFWVLMRLGLAKTKPAGGFFLPARFQDNRLEWDALSALCRERLGPLLATFQADGFHTPCFLKETRHLNPMVVDSGGCWLLHATGRYTAALVFLRTRHQGKTPGIRENLVCFLSCRLASGRLIVVTSSPKHLDPMPDSTVLEVHSTDPAVLRAALEAEIERAGRGDTVRPINTVAEMAADLDTRNEAILRRRLATGRFIAMTLEEVTALQAQIAAQEGGGERGQGVIWPPPISPRR